jgi:lysophospholipase L1-like esterase
MTQPLLVFQPSQLRSDHAPDLNACRWRFLAEGDSWFTIGTLNPAKNSNLLFEMAFDETNCAVNCAMPGDTLRRMVAMNRDPRFVNLLAGNIAETWDALIVSAGGNDLIDALSVGPLDAAGRAVAPELRLLLTEAEWGPGELGAARYFSRSGWQTFAGYLRANVEHLVRLRDSGPSQGRPIFMHCYAYPTPRPAGAGLGHGPWLDPALQTYAVPAEERSALARLLIDELAALLLGMAADPARFPGLDCFDSRAIAIDAAAEGSEGESGDWINEIHLTRRGYDKLARPWAQHIEQVLSVA